MSHVKTGDVIVKDLECLKRVLQKFSKLHWREGQKTYKWYGQWVNDYSQDDAAYKRGIDVADYGKCEHAIRMDGCEYEIGVCKRKDGQGYSLVWDFWGQGKRINEYIGENTEKIMNEYHQEYARTFASNEGMIFNKYEDEEFVYMEITQ